MNAQWKKFTGSEDQISEIVRAKNRDGVKLIVENNHEIEFHPDRSEDTLTVIDCKFYAYDERIGINKRLDISQYMICQPHPHADMIIEWAKTGREVYVYVPHLKEWTSCIDNKPLWDENAKYSFNPDGDGK